MFGIIKLLTILGDAQTIWAWIGAILAIAVAVGAYLQVQEAGGVDTLRTEASTMSAARTSTSASPPPAAAASAARTGSERAGGRSASRRARTAGRAGTSGRAGRGAARPLGPIAGYGRRAVAALIPQKGTRAAISDYFVTRMTSDFLRRVAAYTGRGEDQGPLARREDRAGLLGAPLLQPVPDLAEPRGRLPGQPEPGP